jgi:hypothetical protein
MQQNVFHWLYPSSLPELIIRSRSYFELRAREIQAARLPQQVENMKHELTRRPLSDRILIEQLLADHQPYRKAAFRLPS